MTELHDRLRREPQADGNSDTVKPDAARSGSLGGVNCETGWVAAAAWPVFVFAREDRNMPARVALHLVAILTVEALVLAATGLTTDQASLVTLLGWGL